LAFIVIAGNAKPGAGSRLEVETHTTNHNLGTSSAGAR
jgi:hypothetical protein